ncbi:MAG: UDP-glucose 4-epimerase GalE [Spirochaetaceae bacterium]|jgi:UDP-glucose 4-epimerase|nr:UDP-glucose 4-epimerase GalE [Spirochaetaceae bacterium]
MNILIIGGAGYIGSHVAREMLDHGHRVTIFDNFSSGLEQNVFPEETVVRGDILHPGDLGAALESGFDALVHLAAFKAAGESMVKPEKYSVNNITGTLNILNAAAEAGIRRIVFSSSAAVYGEPVYLPIDEKHPVNPANYYGFTKLEIERFLGWYEKLRGIRFAALRYFNAAGYDVQGRIAGLEKNPANLLPLVMEAAVGKRAEVHIFGSDYDTPDGTCIRDYIHVSDLAAGHLAALDYIAAQDTSVTVNLGSGAGLSVLEMVQAARKITGAAIPVRFVGRRAGDPARLTSSADLARNLFGWTPRHSDPDTLIRTSWNAYNKQKENI